MGVTSTTASPGASRSPSRRFPPSPFCARRARCRLSASIPSPVAALTATSPSPQTAWRKSHLLKTVRWGTPFSRRRLSRARSPSVMPAAASTTNTAISARFNSRRARCTRWAPISPSSSRPGVSIITTGPRGRSSMALRTGSVVVPAMGETMAAFCPVRALTRLDLPALRRPKKGDVHAIGRGRGVEICHTKTSFAATATKAPARETGYNAAMDGRAPLLRRGEHARRAENRMQRRDGRTRAPAAARRACAFAENRIQRPRWADVRPCRDTTYIRVARKTEYNAAMDGRAPLPRRDEHTRRAENRIQRRNGRTCAPAAARRICAFAGPEYSAAMDGRAPLPRRGEHTRRAGKPDTAPRWTDVRPCRGATSMRVPRETGYNAAMGGRAPLPRRDVHTRRAENGYSAAMGGRAPLPQRDEYARSAGNRIQRRDGRTCAPAAARRICAFAGT